MKPRTRLVFALSASFGAILIAAVLYGIPSFTVHATGQPPAVLDKLKLQGTGATTVKEPFDEALKLLSGDEISILSEDELSLVMERVQRDSWRAVPRKAFIRIHAAC